MDVKIDIITSFHRGFIPTYKAYKIVIIKEPIIPPIEPSIVLFGLILGLSFKENCPDVRNTKIIDIVHELEEYNIEVDVYDPWVDKSEAEREYNITPVKMPSANHYEGIILAVAHSEFVDMGIDKIRNFGKVSHVLYDLKYVFDKKDTDIRL